MLEQFDEKANLRRPNRVARHEGDANVRFYYNEVYEADHVEITFPGNIMDVRDTKATEDVQRMYPLAWKLYKEGHDGLVPELAGQTLLSDVDWVDGGSVKHLAALNIFTVEGLAAVTDNNVTNIGLTGRRLRERAKEFVAGREDETNRMSKIEEDNIELRAMVQQQQEQIQKLLEAAKPKKRGRPRKTAVAS